VMSASALPSYLVQLTAYILFGAARDEDHVDPGTHNAFGDALCTPVAWVSCNGETFQAGVVATDLATERGGTDANTRDGARQLGRLNVADVQL
jgi:hypothetical protein